MRVLFCPHSDPGYLYPAVAVARGLRRSGADVLVMGRTNAHEAAAEAGLPFLREAEVGVAGAFSVQRWFLEGPSQYAAVLRAARLYRPDVLVTSALHHGALLAAETLDLPIAVIGFAAHLWSYAEPGRCSEEEIRTRRWRTGTDSMAKSRARIGLPSRSESELERCVRGSLLMLRGLPSFEVPGAVLPDRVIHVGPCWWEPEPEKEHVDAALAQLSPGRPFAYVHLGRTFGGESLWPLLNSAFSGTGLQTVVERGRCHEISPADGTDLSVVRLRWMGPLISRAELVITNATSAPVLGALLHGRPLLVAPCGSEQPVLAAACVRAGVAQVWDRRDPERSATAVRQAVADPGIAEAARRLGAQLAADADGAVAVRAVLGLAGSPCRHRKSPLRPEQASAGAYTGTRLGANRHRPPPG